MKKHHVGLVGVGGVVALSASGLFLSPETSYEATLPTSEVVSFVDTSSPSDLEDLFSQEEFSVSTPQPSPTISVPSKPTAPSSKPLVNSQVEIASTPTPVSTPTPTPTPSAPTVSAAQIVSLVNEQRAKEGIPPLAVNPLLNQSAQVVSNHHVELKYTGHVAPDGKEPFFSVHNVGYAYAAIGENLAYMTPGLGANAVVNEWMKSESHRNTMLSRDFLEAGVGVTNGPVTINGVTYAYVVAMHFGRQL